MILPGGVRATSGRFAPKDIACKVRFLMRSGFAYANAESVIVLTDKPQKPLPASVWETVTEPVNA